MKHPTPFYPPRLATAIPLRLWALLAASMVLSACGTFSALPGHGGGKRYAQEQRLIAASTAAALKDWDVSALRGKRVALVYDLVGDEGTGSLSGGRFNPTGKWGKEYTTTQTTTTTTNTFQVFDLTDNTSECSHTSDSFSGSSGNRSSSSGGCSGSSQTIQVISPEPVTSVVQTEEDKRTQAVQLQLRGLGNYESFGASKSDAALFLALVRNYLMLSGVFATTPDDKEADAQLFISLDIFGMVRSRFDALLYNTERLEAETAFEAFALDKTGQLIMPPVTFNRLAGYTEHYILWVGPLVSTERVHKGSGLLVSFADVDGRQATYNHPALPVRVDHLLGKH